MHVAFEVATKTEVAIGSVAKRLGIAHSIAVLSPSNPMLSHCQGCKG